MAEQVRKAVWSEIPEEQLTDKLGRRMVSGDQVMLAQIRLDKGSVVPRHSHHNEQMSYILEGALRFQVGDEDEEVVVRQGEVLVLPANVPHAAEAIEDSLSLDVFSPPRQDWLDGTDDYLRQGSEPRE